jgi:hypothetical protein
MTSSASLDRGRESFAAHRFGDAVDAVTGVDEQGGLPARDLVWLGTAAVLIGRSTDGIDTLTRAHEQFLIDGDVAGAARCAAWIGLHLMNAQEPARSNGWFARAQRLVREDPHPTSVPGLLLVPEALGALYAGDAERAGRAFEQMEAVGKRFHDPDLSALGRLGQGQARISLGEVNAGLVLLDEAMVAVTAGEISPIPAGIIYCAVLQSCHLAFDLRRAQEWTVALDRWCTDRPDMVVFSGQWPKAVNVSAAVRAAARSPAASSISTTAANSRRRVAGSAPSTARRIRVCASLTLRWDNRSRANPGCGSNPVRAA